MLKKNCLKAQIRINIKKVVTSEKEVKYPVIMIYGVSSENKSDISKELGMMKNFIQMNYNGEIKCY